MASDAASDSSWMRLAIELAGLARGWTSPNPMVGAVVVSHGVVVGKGYHERAGRPHAEIIALDQAGRLARGADLYVSLEPCSHHARTPPCTDRIIEAGLGRVVCAHTDPDARVSGSGIAALRAAGIRVDVGLCEQEAQKLNEHYLHWKRTGRPWVTVKWAQTLDGQVATRTGASRWVTSEAARRQAHRLRSWHDAVLIGVGTALADDPSLNVRMVDGHQPRPVVLDSSLRLPTSAKLVEPGATIIVCDRGADAVRRAAWEHHGVDVAEGSTRDMPGVLAILAERGIQSVLVEGGPQVVTSFLRARVVNRVAAFIAPKIIGTGIAAVGDLGTDVMDAALQLRDVEIEQVDEDCHLTGLLAEG